MEEYKDLIDKLHFFVQENTKDYDESHDVSHAIAVFDNVKNILKLSKVKLEFLNKSDFCYIKVLIIAAFLHDVCDHKYIRDDFVLKWKSMLDFVSKFATKKEKNVIVNIIENMSFSKEKKGLTEDLGIYQILRNVVSDADKLEAIGEIGIKRCEEYTRNHITQDEKEIIKNVVEHCHDKLLKLKDEYIVTDAGKILAIPKHQIIINYVQLHS